MATDHETHRGSRADGARTRSELQEDSDLPEVQAEIRRAIAEGRVRAMPRPGDPTRVLLFTPTSKGRPPAG